MDIPENYYAVLGVPIDADADMLKRAYRQLARRYHPDLAGPGGAIEMKRINRAYAVLSDPEKRRSYDTVIGGVIDLRRGGFARPRPQRPHFDPSEDVEFSGLNIFSTRGPLSAGKAISSQLGVISALGCVQIVGGMVIAAGSLDGKGALWRLVNGEVADPIGFAADPAFAIESLRELRFSQAGTLLGGWGRLGLHVWDGLNGTRLWSYALGQRAVSAHYSLDMTLQVTAGGRRLAHMALPLLVDDVHAPRAWGVRGSDVVSHEMGTAESSLSEPLVCAEEGIEKRQFWAIRQRALTQDASILVTLSCAHLPGDQQEMAIVRRWDLSAKGRMGGKVRPQIAASIVVGRCANCSPPYATTPDGRMVAFVHEGKKLRLCDTVAGTYSELASGTMGSSSKLALSPDGEWAAIAREDSEVNEGVIDLWSIVTGQIVQKLYHPWQISALHFAGKQLVVALTDGTIQQWI
ncbi:MAG TPA: DnaJ domain-containing protein [Ktedonobacteraceae bacterium]|nr:DnaJ domain-containing protein [Ktedonobacteraceae bacterium]